MKKRLTYRPFLAIFLAMLVLQPMLLKEAHHWFGHVHDEAETCTINGQESHLHSEEHGHTSCSLCFLYFAPAKIDGICLSIQPPVFAFTKLLFFHQSPLTARSNWHFQLRGPPSQIA